jgi:glutamate dehydrogenase
VGEWRFLGLYTTAAYHEHPRDIPVLRHKFNRALARAAFPPGGHDYKALVDILETYPRDELFQITEDELFAIAIGILRIGERPQVRLFLRRDPYGRFLSCLVYLPRDRYGAENRLRIQGILQQQLHGISVEHAAHVTESVTNSSSRVDAMNTSAGCLLPKTEMPAYERNDLTFACL